MGIHLKRRLARQHQLSRILGWMAGHHQLVQNDRDTAGLLSCTMHASKTHCCHRQPPHHTISRTQHDCKPVVPLTLEPQAPEVHHPNLKPSMSGPWQQGQRLVQAVSRNLKSWGLPLGDLWEGCLKWRALCGFPDPYLETPLYSSFLAMTCFEIRIIIYFPKTKRSYKGVSRYSLDCGLWAPNRLHASSIYPPHDILAPSKTPDARKWDHLPPPVEGYSWRRPGKIRVESLGGLATQCDWISKVLIPKGPSSQYLRFSASITIPWIDFGTKLHK